MHLNNQFIILKMKFKSDQLKKIKLKESLLSPVLKPKKSNQKSTY